MYTNLLCFFVIISTTKASSELFKENIKYIPDYEYNDFNKITETNLRNNFLDKRKRNRVSENRIKILDKYLFNNTVYIDGIPHYKISKTNIKLRWINEIENEFKRIIAMKGVKYLYKRDAYWRTWREVKYANGDNKIICYRLNNVINLNCSSCHGGGYWTIEDKPPPCPFEIFSIINEKSICAFNYTQFHDKYMRSSCPTKIKFADLTETCDNPIETNWILRRDYKAVSERYPTIICNGRENCEITTVYAITPEHVSFRIINSSNDIIYSKVMKNGGKNYACVDECGQINPNSKTIIQQRKPITFNLFSVERRKKKRDNYFINENVLARTLTEYQNEDAFNYVNKYNNGEHLIEKILEKPLSTNGVPKNVADHGFIIKPEIETTTITHCKRLEMAKDKDLEENETSDYEFEAGLRSPL